MADESENRSAAQPATIELAPGASLEGAFTPGSTAAAVVAPPHPLYGGRMDSAVVVELVRALGAVDVATLAFNWRGVGASAGSPSGADAVADEDYAAALSFLAGRVDAPRWACGYSFGAATAIRAAAADPGIERLVVVAPPAAMIDAESFQRFEGPVFLAVGERDALVKPGALKALVAPMKRAHFCPLADTDHFFMGPGLSQLGRELASWLVQRGPDS